MTAEERLEKLYKDIEKRRSLAHDRALRIPYASLMPKDIDLIVNLVVERLGKGER